MIISRESDYAIRILRVLADGEKHSIREVCETEQVPTQFGYKIIEKLRKGSLVVCERGKYGGCLLNCDLKEVSLYDVLQVIDNECYLNLCLTPGYECPWEATHPDACKVHRKLSAVQNQIDDILRSLKMYNLINGE